MGVFRIPENTSRIKGNISIPSEINYSFPYSLIFL